MRKENFQLKHLTGKKRGNYKTTGLPTSYTDDGSCLEKAIMPSTPMSINSCEIGTKNDVRTVGKRHSINNVTNAGDEINTEDHAQQKSGEFCFSDMEMSDDDCQTNDSEIVHQSDAKADNEEEKKRKYDIISWHS